MYKQRIQSVAPMMVMSQPMLCRCRCSFGSFVATSSCTALNICRCAFILLPYLAGSRSLYGPQL